MTRHLPPHPLVVELTAASEKAGIGLNVIAHALRVDANTVWRWQNGVHSPPVIHVLKWAMGLKATVVAVDANGVVALAGRDIGRGLAELRSRRGWSQRALGRKLRTSNRTVAAREKRGERMQLATLDDHLSGGFGLRLKLAGSTSQREGIAA